MNYLSTTLPSPSSSSSLLLSLSLTSSSLNNNYDNFNITGPLTVFDFTNYLEEDNSSNTFNYSSILSSTIATNNSSNSDFNSTVSPEEDEEISFILPWWRQLIWSVLFGGMVIVATGGNLIVIWIVLAHKRMRTVTNYFIVNLSIADATVSTFNVIFNFIYMLHSHWPFGELYCKISQFVSTLTISASVFTLVAISIDRYMAIINPLKPRMGKRCTLAIAAGIWIISVVIACPMFLFFKTESLELEDGGERIVCFLEWPDGETNNSLQEYVYNIVFMFLTYFIPIGSMSYTYARVGLELWGSQSIGECTHRQLENIKSKRRVVKMMMVVVFIFGVCWLPFHVYFIVTSYYPNITRSSFIQELYLAFYWLAMSNSMYNPIIYCWMNSRFRRGFKQFFRWCPYVHLTPDRLQRREVLTSRYSCSGSPDHNRIIRNDTERSFLYSSCPGSRSGSVRIPMHLSAVGHHHHHHHHHHGTNSTSVHFSQNTGIGNNNNVGSGMQSLPNDYEFGRSNTVTQRWTTSRRQTP
ncbi:tachykinin-like peptides receptor 99D isoform X2 [Condylostylus longicornis]|uniref:tachykinin-like peptides receptor 99D isoform X2 n=1 Tax=Condylostylus longicornis TaxID=2530218 RepID=UPI00244DB819|nr:tachykinin-like peptides receptor 99D isoform X2 [Condylostylus longicornis]